MGPVDSDSECESWMEKMAGDVGSGLVGLLLKSMLTGKWFIVSKIWLPLGGTAPPEAARPQMSKNQNTENKRHS